MLAWVPVLWELECICFHGGLYTWLLARSLFLVDCWLEVSVLHYRGLSIGHAWVSLWRISWLLPRWVTRDRERMQGEQKFVTVKVVLWLYILVIKGNLKSWHLCFVHVSYFREPLEYLCVFRKISLSVKIVTSTTTQIWGWRPSTWTSRRTGANLVINRSYDQFVYFSRAYKTL